MEALVPLFYVGMISTSVVGALWVLKDSAYREMRSGLWAGVVLFLSFFGLGAYLVARRFFPTEPESGPQ